MARSGRRSRTTESAKAPRRTRSSGPRHAAERTTPGSTGGRRPALRAARVAWFAALGAVTLAVVIAVGSVPTRNWLDLRHTATVADRRLSELEAANAEAEAQAAALQSDAEIERMAREMYGYARAGEEVYHLLPEARDPVRVPDAWPFTGLGATIER